MSSCCPPSNAWSHITGGLKEKQLPVISGLCLGLLLYPTHRPSVPIGIRPDDKRTREQIKLLMSSCFSWTYFITSSFTVLFSQSVKKQKYQPTNFGNRDMVPLLLLSSKIPSWNCLGAFNTHTDTPPAKTKTNQKNTPKRAQLLPPKYTLLVEDTILKDYASLRQISLTRITKQPLPPPLPAPHSGVPTTVTFWATLSQHGYNLHFWKSYSAIWQSLP